MTIFFLDSRTTQEMRSELIKLQNTNILLEERLSATSQESLMDKNKYMSQMSQLENENKSIVQKIMEFEKYALGRNALLSENCNIMDIESFLERMKMYLETKHSKSSTLEQKLLKVQTSSQLLQSKADEAKKIIEKEKQKIVVEKEEAIKDRLSMETELTHLKEKLEKDSLNYKHIIKDLENELLNQKLIIENIQKSTQETIFKLKGDLETLRKSYERVIKENERLENKVKELSSENREILDKTNLVINEKISEIENLQHTLNNNNIKTPTKSSIKIQTTLTENKNSSAQTEEEGHMFKILDKNNEKKHNVNMANEIQVFRASTEPTFDFVRNTYFKHKIKQLSYSSLKRYSISCKSDIQISQNNIEDENKLLSMQRGKSSSNINDRFEILKEKHGESSKSNVQSDFYVESFNGNMLRTLSSGNQSNYIQSSQNSQGTSNDLLLMYKNSQTKLDMPFSVPILEDYDKEPNLAKSRDLMKLKTDENLTLVTVDQISENVIKIKREETAIISNNINSNQESKSKIKLDILLPRVECDISQTISNIEKETFDFYSPLIANVSPGKHISSSNNKIRRSKIDISSSFPVVTYYNVKTESFHSEDNVSDFAKITNKSDILKGNKKVKPFEENLNQTDLIININQINTTPFKDLTKNESDKIYSKVSGSAIEIITQIKENRPEKIKSVDDIFDINGRRDNIKTLYNNYVSLTNATQLNNSNTIDLNESNSIPKQTDIINQSSRSLSKSTKRCVNKSILVKLDDTSTEYEEKIKNLTHALENIEKEYKNKIEIIKLQYDNNIKTIINEHNQGVHSIQSLHEETLEDIIKNHEHEIDSLRTLSIEAMKKIDQYDKENKMLKNKLYENIKECDQVIFLINYV